MQAIKTIYIAPKTNRWHFGSVSHGASCSRLHVSFGISLGGQGCVIFQTTDVFNRHRKVSVNNLAKRFMKRNT